MYYSHSLYKSKPAQVWKPLRRYGPRHLMVKVRQDNEEREVPACGLWGQQYVKRDDGDLDCAACLKKAKEL